MGNSISSPRGADSALEFALEWVNRQAVHREASGCFYGPDTILKMALTVVSLGE